MNQQTGDQRAAPDRTEVERSSDRELVVTRLVSGPRHLVFRAWAEAELFRRWWVPKGAGITLVSCELDVRTGGKYRLVFGAGEGDTMAFYGQYLEVVPDECIVWTNDEGDEGPVTTVTFADLNGMTLLTYGELYLSKQELDAAMEGSAAGLPTQLDQLDELLSTIGK